MNELEFNSEYYSVTPEENMPIQADTLFGGSSQDVAYSAPSSYTESEPLLSSFYTASHASSVDYDEDEEDDEDDEIDEYESITSSRSYMQNRELSWLTFDERVLDQGADESVPLLERLNFISIFWSNLQEFFMVRVGSLTDLSYIDPPVRDSKTGMPPKEQIKAIHERCRELYPIQESYYEHVRGSLAKEGVRHLRPDDLSDEQKNYLSGYVKFNVEPFLSPQIINPRHPFPHLENGKLYILLRLDEEAYADEPRKDKKDKKAKKKKKDKGGAEGVVLGLIPLPHQCERVIKLPGRGFQFILLEHAIEMFAPEIFSMYTIKHTNVICVTRNADIDANQTGDEQDDDYREHMKRLLKKRARLAPVRLECERPLSPVMEKLMLKKLGLKRSQVYDTIVPLDLSFTWGLGSLLSESKRARLSNPPFTPAWPTAFDRKRRIIDQVGEREVLLSYPYESMDPFVQLLKEAAFDPTVVSIKITLYRLASQSQLAEALITAAENGKNVTALFELRARFDESNNIEWSQRFEQAGCNVIYGFRDYKVHSKICCITRKLPDGSIQHITQLGTGNYNEKTAKLYTDLSFITTDEAFGRDAMEFFRNMQLENVSDNYEVLRVAPLQIKPMILENLDRQIERARAGLPCGAFMKANSITDKEVIEKISEASQAGVGITLFIRGICCLVPEVKGFTDNVRVVSIVGRLLEHSRIYCFGTPDDCVMYLSSADLMTRNLNKRVEIAWPILSEEIRWRILDYIDICLHDTAKLRELRPNATYTPLGAFCDLDEEGNSQPPFDAQGALIKRAAKAAEKAEEEQAAKLESVAQLPYTMDETQGALDIAPAYNDAAANPVQPIVVGQVQPEPIAQPTYETPLVQDASQAFAPHEFADQQVPADSASESLNQQVPGYAIPESHDQHVQGYAAPESLDQDTSAYSANEPLDQQAAANATGLDISSLLTVDLIPAKPAPFDVPETPVEPEPATSDNSGVGSTEAYENQGFDTSSVAAEFGQNDAFDVQGKHAAVAEEGPVNFAVEPNAVPMQQQVPSDFISSISVSPEQISTPNIIGTVEYPEPGIAGAPQPYVSEPMPIDINQEETASLADMSVEEILSPIHMPIGAQPQVGIVQQDAYDGAFVEAGHAEQGIDAPSFVAQQQNSEIGASALYQEPEQMPQQVAIADAAAMEFQNEAPMQQQPVMTAQPGFNEALPQQQPFAMPQTAVDPVMQQTYTAPQMAVDPVIQQQFAAPQPALDQGMQQQIQNAQTAPEDAQGEKSADFFGDGMREIEMPPQKKGFFSRWRG